MDDHRAHGVVRQWAAGASEPQLRELYERLRGHPSSEWLSRDDLVRLLADEVGRAIVVLEQPSASMALAPMTEEPEPNEAEQRQEEHFLNFTFEYPDGSAAGGYKYRLIEPNGKKSEGTLPGSGLIDRKGVEPGTYQVEIKDVDSVSFDPRTARCDEPVRIVARVWGFDDGASAKVRIFREWAEADDQVITTLDASVAAGLVECELQYDYTADDARKLEQNVARFIAEVSLDGGKIWNKSARPLAMQLKTLTSVRWQSESIGAEEDAVIVVTAPGYAPGAQVALELWTNDPAAGPTKLADLDPAPISGTEARAAIRFAPSDDLDAPAFEAGTIQQPGEYFVRAVIDDDVHREARSGVLLCDVRTLRLSA